MDKFSIPLQESILALIATNDKEGKIAAGLIDASVFDAVYSDFAGRVIAFHKKYDKAPGKAHLDDLVEDILSNDKHAKRGQTIRTIEGILAHADSLNAGYILTRIGEFEEIQRLKGAIGELTERWQNADDNRLADVRAILQKALKPPQNNAGTGVFLNERTKTLSFLDRIGLEYGTGIPEFDRHNFGLRPGRIWLMIAPKGAGKSWWCIDVSARALMQHAKVVHYTLENSWQETVGRYYQRFFAVAQHDERMNITTMELDKLGRVSKAVRDTRRPQLALSDRRIRGKLANKINDWNGLFGNLFIQEYPAGSVSVAQIEAHLDWLELVHGFIPTVCVIDYPDLMFLKGDDKRIALGNTFVELRGLFQRRNLCGACPTQGNRQSLDATTLKTSMVSEDVTKIFTSDMVMLYSQTSGEKEMGWARLTVANNRGGRDKFTVAISQNYDIGQFVTSSARMGNNYFDVVKSEERDNE